MALALVSRSGTAIAIHGRRDEGNDVVWLGGRDIGLSEAAAASLRDAGFTAELNE
jgi:phage replication-related protein YjqB (UPF0714/DUF867 family)